MLAKVRFLLVALAVLMCSFASAKTDTPYRNSQFFYRNTVTVNSLDASSELTYNPYHAMTWGFEPQWWFGKTLYVKSRFSLTREITASDITTYSGETLPSDILFRVGGANIYRIPGVGIDISAYLDSTVPTSPFSKARTLYTALGPGVSLRRAFSGLSGISLGYGFKFTKYLHQYTTSSRESALIPSCPAGDPLCDEFLNTGVRNPSWRMAHSFDASIGFTSWMSLGLAMGIITDQLHPAIVPAEVNFTPQEPQDRRYRFQYDILLSFKPMQSFGIVLGMNTTNPQLAPDSSQYAPIFNRYSVLYMDFKLDVAGLVQQVSDSGSQ